ncbi:MAG: hypothetical protein R3D00_04570 [Bacteroidia bacterium]
MDTIIISSNLPDEIVKKYKSLNQDIKLMILDINTYKNSIPEKILILSKHFPHTELWAIYDSRSTGLKEELFRLGFSKIISYNDNLPQIIAESDLRQ